jgi:hypothetical protein
MMHFLCLMTKEGMDAVFVKELNMWVSINMYSFEWSDARDGRAIDMEGFESRQLYLANRSLVVSLREKNHATREDLRIVFVLALVTTTRL